MNFVIIIIVAAAIVIGNLLYSYISESTERKFKKGVKALDENNLDLAEQYFREISEKHSDAKNKIEEVIYKRGEISEGAGNLEKAYEYFSTIQNNSKAAERIIEIDFTRGLAAKRNGDLDTAYSYFSKIATKNKKAFLEAARIDFKKGVDAELSKDYTLAKKFYLKSSLYKEDPKVYYSLVCRKLICELKADTLPNEKEISEIANSTVDNKLKNDFFYRYAVRLLKDQNLNLASEIIKNKLDKALPEVKVLESFILNYKRRILQSIIAEINEFLSKPESNSILMETLYKKLEEYKSVIHEFPEYSETILEIQKNIFGKLLSQYLSENEFEKCLNHIIGFPKFYEHIELIKNAGICCIRIALEKKINETNYKKIIPIWVTTIYNDDVFINSLESTTWDDDITFTVEGAIGKYGSFIYKREWTNINREKPSDINISIGDSQRELINLFERALNNIQPEALHNEIYTFYKAEKEAISDLVEVLGYDTLHATPEFSNTFNIGDTILERANWRFEKNESEKLLKSASKYINLVIEDGGVRLQTNYKFEKYASSLWYQKLALKHVSNKAIQNLSRETFKPVIERFESIKKEFEEKSIASIRSFISSNDQDESLIPLIEKILEIIPSSQNLKYLFADYTTSYCIDKINSKSINEIKALEFLVKAIAICPDNHRTATNLAVFISLNLISDNFRQKVQELIPSVKKIESESLYNSFKNELLPFKNELREYLNKPNINYMKVQRVINVIDELINSARPFSNNY